MTPQAPGPAPVCVAALYAGVDVDASEPVLTAACGCGYVASARTTAALRALLADHLAYKTAQ